ncbi:MAG TPA: hypothetical protein VFU46_14545 [Gemmatimonadales bacterium]|nr:hypothetical protein [Gemmatimonadales bacterium]
MRTTGGLLLTLGGLLTAACDANGPGSQGRVEMNLATRAAAVASPSVASLAVTSPSPGTFSDGSNTLVITRAQVVLREIELERAGEDGVCDGLNDDACEELSLGPILADLPLTAGAEQTIVVDVPAGAYDQVEFEIHKPTDDDDPAFVAANPAFNDRSIRVEGTYNGNPFVFTSDLNIEQEIELATPLTIAESGAVDLTLFVDVSQWFQTGGSLLDPATADLGQPNEGLVKENIKNSIEAFEDGDEDGRDD